MGFRGSGRRQGRNRGRNVGPKFLSEAPTEGIGLFFVEKVVENSREIGRLGAGLDTPASQILWKSLFSVENYVENSIFIVENFVEKYVDNSVENYFRKTPSIMWKTCQILGENREKLQKYCEKLQKIPKKFQKISIIFQKIPERPQKFHKKREDITSSLL